MTTEENIAQREMTLREFVERLPEGHRVRIELAALEADNAAKDVAIRGAIAKSPGHGPLWYGSKEMDCLRAALTPDSGKVQVCEWSTDPSDDFDDTWQTECGHEFIINDGKPSENDMQFCCFCGRKLDERIEVKSEDDDDEED